MKRKNKTKDKIKNNSMIDYSMMQNIDKIYVIQSKKKQKYKKTKNGMIIKK